MRTLTLVSRKLWPTSLVIINFFSEHLEIVNDLIEDEQNSFDGRVPTLDVSNRDDGEISESEDELDADAIRNASTAIATDLDNRDPPRAAPAR